MLKNKKKLQGKLVLQNFKCVFLKMSIFSVFTKFSPSSLVIFYSRAFKFDMLIPGVILHRTDLLEFLIFVYFILNKFF